MKLTQNCKNVNFVGKKSANSGGFPFRKHSAHASSKFIFKYIFDLLSIHDIYQFHFARRVGTPFPDQ
jgi:hypothetical protein